jgi:hypothetical protein
MIMPQESAFFFYIGEISRLVALDGQAGRAGNDKATVDSQDHD